MITKSFYLDAVLCLRITNQFQPCKYHEAYHAPVADGEDFGLLRIGKAAP